MGSCSPGCRSQRCCHFGWWTQGTVPSHSFVCGVLFLRCVVACQTSFYSTTAASTPSNNSSFNENISRNVRFKKEANENTTPSQARCSNRYFHWETSAMTKQWDGFEFVLLGGWAPRRCVCLLVWCWEYLWPLVWVASLTKTPPFFYDCILMFSLAKMTTDGATCGWEGHPRAPPLRCGGKRCGDKQRQRKYCREKALCLWLRSPPLSLFFSLRFVIRLCGAWPDATVASTTEMAKRNWLRDDIGSRSSSDHRRQNRTMYNR